MRLLILGGTQFLGRAIATHAIACGHDVTCAARGTSGTCPSGARFVQIDRDRDGGLDPLMGETFDAVVDVARHPGHVRRAIAALRAHAGHWTLVSTISVYADNRTQGQSAGSAPLLDPTPDSIDESTPETYGAAKRACELAVGDDAFICRAGLIVGPEDPTGRFTYWPSRLHRGGEVLVAGSPDDPVQFVDVRDLAAWIVRAGERRLIGAIDGTGPAMPMGRFLNECGQSIGAECTFTWVDRAFMAEQNIRHWAGPRSLPLWVPLPDFAGLMTRNVSQALASGLNIRPLPETARDTLDWAQTHASEPTGLTPQEEADALTAWHAQHPAAAPSPSP